MNKTIFYKVYLQYKLKIYKNVPKKKSLFPILQILREQKLLLRVVNSNISAIYLNQPGSRF